VPSIVSSIVLSPPATITRRPSFRHVASASEPVVPIVLPPCSTNSFAPPFFWRQTVTTRVPPVS
jgi:hypothetical protein